MNINSKPNSNKIQTYDYVYYKHQNFSQVNYSLHFLFFFFDKFIFFKKKDSRLFSSIFE